MKRKNSKLRNVDKSVHIAGAKAAGVLALVFVLCGVAVAADWPARLHDARRSGITTEQLSLPISQLWVYTTGRAPKPAWTEEPAVTDFWGGTVDFKPRQNFDRSFDVAVVGNYAYFGSSDSGAVTCLNTADGSEVWTYFTGGPVRFAPFVDSGKVYVGSDDGYVYCLNATNGSLVWSQRAGPTDEMMWSNQQMSSVWAVRTGVVVAGGYVYWSAGIWPAEGMYLCRRDAATGTGGWTQTPVHPPQGYLLASASRLYMPCGKTFPAVYTSSSGALEGVFSTYTGSGGCWCLLTPDETHLWYGPHYGTVDNSLGQYNASTRAYIGYIYGGNYMVADATYAYYVTDTTVVKINRSTRAVVWTKSFVYPYSLIMAGTNLFAGGDGQIAAFNASDGTRTWTAAVAGKAWGLAVANGGLFASTDTGSIHCFTAGPPDTTPPTPNPMTWATVPYATGSTSIKMVATTASDPSGVEYYFTCTAGGGHNSSWQDSTTYEDTGLQPNTTYTYTVKARDKSPNLNETAASTAESATTESAPPALPWSDGFESGNFTVGGWTTSGTTAVVTVPYTGIYSAQVQKVSWIQKAISTGGFNDIHVKYARKTIGLDAGEYLYVEWSTNGTNWNNLETTQDTAWSLQDKLCGTGANNNVNFRVRFRTNSDKSGEAAYVDAVDIFGIPAAPDTTPPTPNPMTWATVPYATGSTSIKMVATTASDPSSVEYYFTCTAGGGHNSSWQDSTTYEDTGLQPNTTYTYTVKARDKSPNLNETAASTAESATTLSGSPPGQATNPYPPNGATNVSKTVVLTWTAGEGATSHDVYFGTSSPPPFVQNQAGTSYDPPGSLGSKIWYYWRIDEVNEYGTTTGVVWSFQTGK
jgi:outer membrane protein assembly factor BamB